jgi:RNA polymerase sigma factor (sigma-70 family)
VDDATTSVPGIPAVPQKAIPGLDLADVSTVEYAMVYQAEKPRLIRYLLHCGASYQAADDAAQHALTTLYVKWGNVRNPGPWLRKVAMRELRRASVINECSLEDHDQPLDAQPGPVCIESFLEKDIVLSAILQLPLSQRQVFALHFDQFKTSEIAEILQISEDAVRQNLARARARLRELPNFIQHSSSGQDGTMQKMVRGHLNG